MSNKIRLLESRDGVPMGAVAAGRLFTAKSPCDESNIYMAIHECELKYNAINLRTGVLYVFPHDRMVYALPCNARIELTVQQ